MKKFLLVVLGLIVVLIGALVLAPFLIPTDTYKEQVAQRVEAATGRELTIEGPVSLSLLPTIALEAQGVRFANVPDAANADMVALQEVQVELRVWPLLTGSVEVARFVLIQPVIHLEVDQSGRPNWQFGQPAAAAEDTAAQTGNGGVPSLPVADLKLGDIRLVDGIVTYSDATNGTSERLEDIDMSLELPDLRSPFAADGSLEYKGKPVTLDLRVKSPLALIQSGASSLVATVSAPDLELAFDGQAQSGPATGVQGGIELDVRSIRELAAWLAEPLDFEGEGLQTLRIAGQLEATPQRLAFTEAAIDLDEITSSGEFVADLQGTIPRLSGRLDVGALNVNPYLPPEAVEPGTEPEADGDGGEAPAAGWSDEPLALPPIGGVELDFALTVDSLQYQELELGRTALDLKLIDDVFTADLTEFRLYDGEGSGRLEVALVDGTPVIREDFRLEGLDARPFLSAVADLDRLEGTATLDLSTETRGTTERQLVENLQGKGNATFLDGAIVGINIAAMVRNVTSAFLDPEAREEQKTDFAELSGSFTIEDGIVVNDDMRLQAPVMRVNGSGRIDLPARRLSYRLEPKAAATLEGQGGEEDVAGILVPVVIEGPWDDLSYRPDLSGVLETALESPEALKQQLERLGESPEAIREAIDQIETKEQAEQLLEQLQKPGGAESLAKQVEEKGARGLLESLTGGGGGGESPAAEQEPAQDQQEQPAEAAKELLKGLFNN